MSYVAFREGSEYHSCIFDNFSSNFMAIFFRKKIHVHGPRILTASRILFVWQVSALKAQISTYQKEAIEAKMGVDGEIGRRVELESKLQTKDEEIAFLKKVYEEVSIYFIDHCKLG